ncbi:MAG: hypothetical protein ACFE88_16580 [Candidatus Hermodarchaeota archaeon]
MATYNEVQNSTLPHSYSHLKCDICGSADIVDTIEGYVCRECGIVLEIKKLQYDKPYNEDIIQYARGVGTTQIGTRRERVISPHSIKLQRINKYNSITNSERTVLDKARIEISRIFNSLDLVGGYDDIKEMVLNKFKLLRARIRPGSKYRSVEKLVSITIYFCLKLRNISINPYELIENSNITKKEFNDFNLQLQRFLPNYAERNRQEYILQRILEISEHFELGIPFYYLSKKILYRLWQGIKNTTDNVVAGLVSSISILCSYKEKVSVSSICNRLGIRMSTIQAQVKKKIFEKFKVHGFISLIRSSDILVKIMEKIGVLEKREADTAIQEEEDYRQIVLGNATNIFNAKDNFDYYYFAMRGQKSTPVIVTLKINDFPLVVKSENRPEIQSNELLNFEIFYYYSTKDPPGIKT